MTRICNSCVSKDWYLGNKGRLCKIMERVKYVKTIENLWIIIFRVLCKMVMCLTKHVEDEKLC